MCSGTYLPTDALHRDVLTKAHTHRQVGQCNRELGVEVGVKDFLAGG